MSEAFARPALELSKPVVGNLDVAAAPSGGQGLSLDERGRVPSPTPTALPFDSDWSNFSASFQGGEYWKDLAGIVHLRVVVTKSGTPGSGDTIATLPAECRPTMREIFTVGTGESNQFGRVDVQTDGTITWQTGGTTETDFVSLSGISFRASG